MSRARALDKVYETRNWTDYLASEDFRALLDQVAGRTDRARANRVFGNRGSIFVFEKASAHV